MRRTRLRSVAKKNTLSYWKKKFWTTFSLYIRTRDDFTCFTCGKKNYGRGLHAGHMIPRASGGLTLYFNEKNVNAQCYHCNINLGGNGAMYAKLFITKYGQAEFDEMIRLKHQGYKKYSIEEYKMLIEEYKDKIKDYDKNNK